MTIKRMTAVAAALLGLGLVIAGPVATVQGFDARSQVRAELVAQHIVTPADASVPNTPVTNARMAQVQANIIEKHILESTGGKTYAQMTRTDPKRAVAASGEALRTSLLSAVLAENVANLVIGLGVFLTALGLVMGLIAAVFWRDDPATLVFPAHEPRTQRAATA